MSAKKLFLLYLVYFLFLPHFVFAKKEGDVVSSKQSVKSSISKTSYSFRPLLIQGKKRFSEESKDLKIEGESIVESEVFSIKHSVRDRIFEWESL